MKILIVGRGVIGTIYGWALEQAGHTVEFLVRPGRAAAYGPVVQMELLDGRQRPTRKITTTWPVRLRESLPAEHTYDVIMISVVSDRLAEAAAQIGPLAGRASVLLFSNVWDEPEAVVAPIPVAQRVWGFPGAGGGFDPAGTLKGNLLRSVTFGTLGAPLTARDHAVRALFRAAGFAVREQRDFRSWLWLHFILNAGLHVETSAAGGGLELLQNPRHLQAAILNIRELLPLITARGGRLTMLDRAPFCLPARLTSFALHQVMQRVELVGSVLRNHTNDRELLLYGQEVLQTVRAQGFAAPRLEARLQASASLQR